MCMHQPPSMHLDAKGNWNDGSGADTVWEAIEATMVSLGANGDEDTRAEAQEYAEMEAEARKRSTDQREPVTSERHCEASCFPYIYLMDKATWKGTLEITRQSKCIVPASAIYG